MRIRGNVTTATFMLIEKTIWQTNEPEASSSTEQNAKRQHPQYIVSNILISSKGGVAFIYMGTLAYSVAFSWSFCVPSSISLICWEHLQFRNRYICMILYYW